MSDWQDMQRSQLVCAMVPLDLFLLWPAGRLLVQGETGAANIARNYLKARMVVGLLLVALTPVLSALEGPIPPRVLGVAWAFLMWRCLDED